MKKKIPMIIAIVLIVILVLLVLNHEDLSLGVQGKNEVKLENITQEKGYRIMDQDDCVITLSIPKEKLPDDIYTAEGHIFEENEIIVYQTDTTSIYLKHIMLANEGDEYLYFFFDFSYDLPEKGVILYPYEITEENYYTNCFWTSNKTLTDSVQEFPNAISIRGQGPEEEIAIYVDTDVCNSATGMIQVDIGLNELTYVNEVDFE